MFLLFNLQLSSTAMFCVRIPTTARQSGIELRLVVSLLDHIQLSFSKQGRFKDGRWFPPLFQRFQVLRPGGVSSSIKPPSSQQRNEKNNMTKDNEQV